MASGAAMTKIERAHQMYREGRYEEALGFYTEALSLARTKPQKIALHSNRAACYLKLHDFNKAADECTSVLELDQKHSGALMLRAQTLVTLKDYHSALFDVNRLIELNPSSEVYQNLQARLKTQLSLAPIPEAEIELEEDENDDEAADHMENKENACEVVGEREDLNNATRARRLNIQFEYADPVRGAAIVSAQPSRKTTEEQSGWQTIAKPKGHSRLDYSRWDRVEGDSSEDDDDDEDDEEGLQLQYKFRLRTVDVRAVK